MVALNRGLCVNMSYQVTMPAGSSATISFAAPDGVVYVVFQVTHGRPLDSATNTYIYSSLFRYTHTHAGNIRTHSNPAVISLIDFEHPHYMEVTQDYPSIFEIVNGTAFNLVWDLTLHFIEVNERNMPFLRKLLEGEAGLSPEEQEEMEKKVDL